MDISQLEAIYAEYGEKLGKAHKKASLLSGLFGQGSLDDPRGNPCNQEFYEKTGQWVADFAASAPEEAEVLAVCRYIFSQARDSKAPTYWYCLVAQGYTEPLIAMLSPGSCGLLRDEYNALYPKRRRLPLQDKIYRLLCDRAG